MSHVFRALYRKSVAVINSVVIFIRSFFFLEFREWFCVWFTFSQEVTVHLDTIPFVIRTHTFPAKIVDLYMAASCVLSHQYTPKDFVIKSTDTVIDIGAHIGSFSIIAGRAASRGKVFSFEPDPVNCAQLTKNVNANNLRNVTISPKAVYLSTGKSYLNRDTLNSAEHGLYKKGRERVVVPTITLDDIFEENKIKICNILKLDCEGAEYDIVFGASPDTLRRIEKIVMECHEPAYFGITNPQYSQEKMLDYLGTHGFEARRIFENAMHSLIYARRTRRSFKKTKVYYGKNCF